MIKNIRIGSRLGAGFAVVLVFSMVVAATGIWRLKTVAQQTQEMMDVPLKTERLVSQWNTLLLIAIQRTTTVVRSRDPELEAFLAKEAAASSQNRILLLEVLILLCGVSFAVLLTRSITRPVHAALAISQRVAAGDLTSRAVAVGRDELGQLVASLQGMSERLHGVVATVRQGADSIAIASGEIANGNLDLSARTEEQAGALEETAASIEQLTSSVRTNSDNAHQANDLVSSAASVAGQGGVVMEQLIATMATINESSRKIVDIIGVIDGIAFQTNILALNAAVEAARAGEQGRGFAVVASEVRALAQRSAAAAKEIKQLIDDSVDKVGAGSALVQQAGKTMQEVVGSVQGAHTLVGEISTASREQAEGIHQVNQAVSQMDGVTQQNAALVEQAAAAAKSLEDQAAELKRAVAFFSLQHAG